MRTFEENYKMKDKNTQYSRHSKTNSYLRWNPLGNWVIIIFIGQKPCVRIISIIAFLFTLFEGYKLEKCTKEIMRYGLKYSSTRFLSPENKNYSIS